MFEILIEQKYLTIIIIVLLTLSIIFQVMVGLIYQRMIHESDSMSSTKNKQLKQCKLKFANCYQLNGSVSNIPVFVDKFINRIHILNISLTSLSHLSAQLILLSVFVSGIGVCMAIVAGETLLRVLPYYMAAIISLYLYFSISGFIDIKHRKEVLKINLIDYLENHMMARMNHQMGHAMTGSLTKTEEPAAAEEPEKTAGKTYVTLKTEDQQLQNQPVPFYGEEELENLLKELFI